MACYLAEGSPDQLRYCSYLSVSGFVQQTFVAGGLAPAGLLSVPARSC